MDDPVAEISTVIHKLTQGSPQTQQETIEEYFIPKASFFHPFCSVHHNRKVILRIFQWYKILSPHIDISVNSIAFDAQNLSLYITLHQIFRIFFIPFYRAPVTLTTVLQLERGHNLNLSPSHPHHHNYTADLLHPHKQKFYIKSQNDLYQVDQFVRFVLPWGVGTTFVLLWHWFATLACIVGAVVGAPLRWNAQVLAERRPGRWDVDVEESEAVAVLTGREVQGSVSGNGALTGPYAEWESRLREVAVNERAVVEVQKEHLQVS